VTNEASSDKRNSMTAATSSGSPYRFIGVSASKADFDCSAFPELLSRAVKLRIATVPTLRYDTFRSIYKASVMASIWRGPDSKASNENFNRRSMMHDSLSYGVQQFVSSERACRARSCVRPSLPEMCGARCGAGQLSVWDHPTKSSESALSCRIQLLAPLKGRSMLRSSKPQTSWLPLYGTIHS